SRRALPPFPTRRSSDLGDLTFELRHARGETDDATWTWIPERKIVAPGDLFIWAAPNAGNPQKVQRYCGEWAVALREMSALGAERSEEHTSELQSQSQLV